MIGHSRTWIHRILAATLILSVSVCCCHAHILLSGFSNRADAPGANACATACCAGCAGETGSDRSDDAPDSVPVKRCKACCIKGTGLKDAPGLIAAPVAAAPLWSAPALVAPPRAVALAHRPDARAPALAPPTLLRLRCALIV